MTFRFFSRVSRLVVAAAAGLVFACSSPSGNDNGGGGGGDGDKSAITGTVQFRANGGPVDHHVYMAAFFSHEGAVQISSNIIDLGMTALQSQAFSLTPVFPAGAVPGDFMVFSAWLDTDDNGVYNDEQRQPMPTEGPDDTVFLVGDSLLLYDADGWHFENAEGGIGELYDAHVKTGTKLISVSMN